MRRDYATQLSILFVILPPQYAIQPTEQELRIHIGSSRQGHKGVDAVPRATGMIDSPHVHWCGGNCCARLVSIQASPTVLCIRSYVPGTVVPHSLCSEYKCTPYGLATGVFTVPGTKLQMLHYCSDASATVHGTQYWYWLKTGRYRKCCEL